MATDYTPPLDKFLTLGEPPEHKAPDWPNYIEEFGLGPEHIPELIRLATDHDLRWDEESEVAYWAPIYAWRALGQLRAETAVAPLVRVLDEEDDEWAAEELPEVFTMIGPAAIPPLIAYLADQERNVWGRGRALASLEAIAKQYPETHDDVIAAIRRQLEAFPDNNPILNGFLIDILTEFKVADAIPIMEQAFTADRVDPLLTGWEDVQEAFGMITPEEGRRLRMARRASLPQMDNEPSAPTVTPAGTSRKPAKAKAKRKMAKASRQKNRKRK